jgi:Helix-turn-helix domain
MRQWPERRRERLWELWAQGHSIHAIAREMGTFRPSVTRYLNSTGGVRPLPRRRSERCLSAAEREEISRGLARGESFRAIARQIGRPHTTVSREVKRHGGRRRYRARSAEAAAWRRARRPKPSKLAANARLRAWSARSFAATGRRSRSPPGFAAPTVMIQGCRSPTRRSISRSLSSRAGRSGASSVTTCVAAGVFAAPRRSAQNARDRVRSRTR